MRMMRMTMMHQKKSLLVFKFKSQYNYNVLDSIPDTVTVCSIELSRVSPNFTRMVPLLSDPICETYVFGYCLILNL